MAPELQITPETIFDLANTVEIFQHHGHIIAYPYVLNYFSSRWRFSATDFAQGALMVYGSLCTTLEFPEESAHSRTRDTSERAHDLSLHDNSFVFFPTLEDGARILNKVKECGEISGAEETCLEKLINNSITGVSHILHYAAPDHFAMWGPEVYRFIYQEQGKVTHYHVNDSQKYHAYLRALKEITKHPQFSAFHAAMNRKIGYDVSPLRALQLIMRLKGSA